MGAEREVRAMSCRILIAEDESQLCEVLCDYFRSKGQTPVPAGSGAQALALAESEDYDAVLLDIMMPELDGFSVCRALRKKQEVPIVFLTALSDEEDKLYTQYEQTREQLHEGKAECARLNKALEYAKTAEQNRRQMTSNIAHELKTPLAVIHSYAEGLKEHIAEHKRERYLDVILSESERMDAMVLELLDLSRLEAGKVKLAHDEFSLSGLVRGIAEKLETAIQEKELQVTFDAPQACLVTADEARIGQVVENFMTNAVKYTPCGGNIAVRISQQQGKTAVSIANDCEALSAEQLARVWDTFYRVQPERDRKGSGLGLAIAKNIVELHGGTCGARSIPTGVEFYFTI